VKLGLPGKPQAGSGSEHIPRQPVESLDTVDSCPSGGLPFLLDKVSGIIRRNEEVTVQSRKVALDPFFESNPVDPIYSGRVAMSRQLCAGLAMETFYFHVAIVEGVRQVRRRPLSHASARLSGVQQDDGFALLHQAVGRREPGDSSPYNAHVGVSS
jgi:hypothetical protein